MLHYTSYLHPASSTYKYFIVQLMHNYIRRRKIWNYRIFKSAPTCFGSQRIHHQGALYSAWLKITRMVLSCPLTWTGPVLWQRIVTRCVCVYVCSSLSRKALKYCTRLPDDGSSVIRNMLEHF